MAVHVHVSDDAVHVTFTGADKWLTVNPKGQHVAMADITSARVISRAEAGIDLSWRFGGAWWPGKLATGWFMVKGREGARQLWCVYGDQEVLAIETRLERPCRVVLQHPDRHDLAWYIGERLARR